MRGGLRRISDHPLRRWSGRKREGKTIHERACGSPWRREGKELIYGVVEGVGREIRGDGRLGAFGGRRDEDGLATGLAARFDVGDGIADHPGVG